MAVNILTCVDESHFAQVYILKPMASLLRDQFTPHPGKLSHWTTSLFVKCHYIGQLCQIYILVVLFDQGHLEIKIYAFILFLYNFSSCPEPYKKKLVHLTSLSLSYITHCPIVRKAWHCHGPNVFESGCR